MHQSKLGNHLVLVDVQSGMHEEVVHLQRVEIMLSVDFSTTNVIDFNVNLHEGEDHVENRVDAREDVPGAAADGNLNIYAEI